MGGRRRGNDDEGFERGEWRPVEPEEARAHGNDPDAVEINREGGDREGSGRQGGSQGGRRGSGGQGSGGSRGGRGDEAQDRYGEEEGSGRREGLRDEGASASAGAAAGDRARYNEDENEGASSGRGAGGGASRRRRRGRDGDGDDDGREETAAPAARRDSVRWGPIWAGLVAALTTFLLLELLALGLGLLTPGDGAGYSPGIASAIIGLIAFLTGGSVAGMTSAVRGAGTGLLNGLLVWALGTVLILALSALGLGQLFGALGSLAGGLGPGALGGAANSASGAAQNVNPQQAADAVRTGAIGAFFGLLVSAIASALGGYLGGRSREPIGRMANDQRGDH